jgi:hypothetical protein
VGEKLVLDKPLDGNPDSTFGMGLASGSQLPALDSSSRLGLKSWQKLKPFVEILCNNQASICTSSTFVLSLDVLISSNCGGKREYLSLHVYIKYLLCLCSTDQMHQYYPENSCFIQRLSPIIATQCRFTFNISFMFYFIPSLI